jgi:two-component system C4-dicarboxylate transport sensor histidine kinase DctB
MGSMARHRKLAGLSGVGNRRTIAVFLFVALIVAAAAYFVSHAVAVGGVQQKLDQSLILTRRAIESEIERFRYLPDVAAEDARITAALNAPDDPAAIAAANRYLQTIAAKSGAAELYLLNSEGTAITASNWATPGSFVGSNYGFRPYFKDALSTGRGRFYAIGVTTGKPGYFLSSRIDRVAPSLGVMVVKVDLTPLEETWKAAGVPTAIADRDGVVFLSAVEHWLYRPLARLPADTLSRLAETRTYDGVALADAPPLLDPGTDAAAMLRLPAPDGSTLIGRTVSIEPDGWRVISAAPVAGAVSAALAWAVGSALVAMAGTGLALIFNQRRQLVQLRLRQGALLEARVSERTRELAHEIEARRKTEADLRAAQESLVHTEKMAALGRMSAAIVHEISQPLAAMEATLAAAEISADSDSAKTGTRIGRARALIGRMQRTTKHLKTFSRKDTNTLTLVDLNKVVESALELVAPRAKVVGVIPVFQRTNPVPEVMAGAVRLEQVCLNLLLNALDAVEGRQGATITVSTGVEDGHASIEVRDTGTGIAPEDIARATEPFFSTKIGGEGLGLGLSISQAIVTEFGGRIDIASPLGAGTRVTVTLPLAKTAREAAE